MEVSAFCFCFLRLCQGMRAEETGQRSLLIILRLDPMQCMGTMQLSAHIIMYLQFLKRPQGAVSPQNTEVCKLWNWHKLFLLLKFHKIRTSIFVWLSTIWGKRNNFIYYSYVVHKLGNIFSANCGRLYFVEIVKVL